MKLKKSSELREGVVLDFATSLNNKTGNWKVFRPKVDFNKCIHCMKCVLWCPDMCIPEKNEKRLETNFEMCKGCLICEEVCPVKCINHEKV